MILNHSITILNSTKGLMLLELVKVLRYLLRPTRLLQCLGKGQTLDADIILSLTLLKLPKLGIFYQFVALCAFSDVALASCSPLTRISTHIGAPCVSSLPCRADTEAHSHNHLRTY